VSQSTINEKNARRRDLRFQRISERYESLKSALIHLWTRAAKEHWTHDRILEYRREWIPRINGTTDKFPDWVEMRLQGVSDTLFDLHFRQLTFCYAHPQTGVVTPADQLCHDGLASQLDTATGAHYYKNDDGTFSDRF